MTNTVIIKRSATPNAVPTAGQLVHGELAINYRDGNLFYKNDSNQVLTIASNQFVSVTGNVTGGNLITNGGISAGNSFGLPGQVLTATGSNTAAWTNQFYVGNAPPQANSITPKYGDVWYYISDDGLDSRLYMWVTDGTSEYFYDFLPPSFP